MNPERCLHYPVTLEFSDLFWVRQNFEKPNLFKMFGLIVPVVFPENIF